VRYGLPEKVLLLVLSLQGVEPWLTPYDRRDLFSHGSGYGTTVVGTHESLQ
jgi:hypothetical protein